MSTLFATINLTHRQKALVNIEDYPSLSQYRWYAQWDSAMGSYYATRGVYSNGKKYTLAMHRAIMGLGHGDEGTVDHINGDTLDNRRVNLRMATVRQQAQNRHYHRSGTKISRYIGVSSVNGCTSLIWRAFIKIDYRYIHLGHFKTEEGAAKAYDAALVKLGLKPVNFPRHKRALESLPKETP